MAKRDKKTVPPSALPTGGVRVPIKNAEAAHSFVVSLIYLEDAGPVVKWSDDASSLFAALQCLGSKQRDSIATTGNRRDHYQNNKDRLLKEALKWLADRPAVSMLDEYLWTFHVNGKHRIWGILTDNVFYLLWNDPEHAIYEIDLQDRSEGKRR